MCDSLLQELVAMSRYLGDPTRGYAIHGEGNTSGRIDEGTFYVKASGTSLSNIDAQGFVAVSTAQVTPILDNPAADDAEVTRVFNQAVVDPNETRRPSVETILHAVLLQIPGYNFVAHTHPVYTTMLLCSDTAEEAAEGRLFPDQVVCMGRKSVFVPYVDPGLELAREVRKRVAQFIEAEGVLPKAIMMQNHGFIAVGDTPKAVTSCTDMAEKASKVLVGAHAAGGPRFMAPADVERIFTRPDEAYRSKSIAS